MAQDGEVGRDGRGHALDHHLLQRPDGAGDGDGAIPAPDDELADQVVVVLADRVAALVAAVEPGAEPVGRREAGDRARAGEEAAAGRVLGVDPDLDGVPAPLRQTSSWLMGSGSPEATLTCHSTRSIPVTISVTGCSTWSRVFISRKKNSPSWKMNSTVPALV